MLPQDIKRLKFAFTRDAELIEEINRMPVSEVGHDMNIVFDPKTGAIFLALVNEERSVGMLARVTGRLMKDLKIEYEAGKRNAAACRSAGLGGDWIVQPGKD